MVDSGASVNFISPEVARKLVRRANWKRFSPPLTLKLGDGSKSSRELEYFIRVTQSFPDGSTTCFSAIICELNKDFDIVLGKRWLKDLSAIQDHKNDSVQVITHKGPVTLYPILDGNDATSGLEYNELRAKFSDTSIIGKDELLRLQKSEELEELFLVHMKPDETEVHSIDPRAAKILEYYPTVTGKEGSNLVAKERLRCLGAHKIVVTEGSQPIKKQQYRMSPRELAEVEKQIKKLSEKGMIRPSASPWAAPVIFAKKKDGTLRMCVDYRALNRITTADSYPIPRIDDNLDRLGGCSVFSIIDLESGFHQLPMEDQSVEKTAFVTRYGQYEYLVMPFGLRNAPSSFQRIMNSVLGDLVDSCCVVYLDDILIYSKTIEEHEAHLKGVLERLNHYGLLINMKKSKFYCEEVKYLGFKISNNSVHVDEEKINVIKEWRTPQSVTEVRSFLGLANYYRRFIQNYTKLAMPLLELTKKDREFKWSEECQQSFVDVKRALMSAPVLRMPDFSREFHIWPDASNFAAGGVLTQDFGSGHQPIAFLSKKFSDTESKYSTTERELLAILICLRRWRCYVDGRRIYIHSDHKPLTWARGLRNPKPRVWSWLEEMEYYAPSIMFVPGDNQPGDPLSRLCESKASIPEDNAPSVSETSDLVSVSAMDRLEGYAGEVGEPKVECKTNLETYTYMNSFVVEGESYPDSDWPLLSGLYLLDQQLPLDLSVEQLEMIQEEADNFEFKGNVLTRKIIKRNDSPLYLPFILTRDRLQKISKYHQLLGHLAGESTYKILKDRYWWPEMKDEIYSFISNCRECQLSSSSKQLSAPLHPIPPAPLPFERWGVDFLQDLPLTDQGNRNVLVFIDYATRWPVVIATKDRTSRTVYKEFLKNIVNHYGIPDSIISDRAKYFKEGVFGNYLKKNHVKHLLSSSHHPRTNGMTERLNRVLKDMLRRYCDGLPEKWDKVLDKACFALRVRIHSVTQRSPFYLLYGRHPRLPGDEPPDNLFDFSTESGRNEYTIRELQSLGQDRAAAFFRSQEQAKRMIEEQETREETEDGVFRPGMFVKKKNFIKQSLDYPWTGPYIVTEILPNSLYRLMAPDGSVLSPLIHQDDLRLYSSKDTSKLYHNRKMKSLTENVDNAIDSGENSEEDSNSSEGGVVV